jgi:hypothetical protein
MKYEYRQNKDGKIAIFDLETDNQISDWFDYIEMYETIYLGKKGRKYAIFDFNGKQLSDWFDKIYISSEGLKIQTNLYIAGKNGEYAIFDLDGNQISDWFYNIKPDGLIEGRSNYYIARVFKVYNKKPFFYDKEAIFDKNGNRISDWFDNIKPDGLVRGTSNYFIVEKRYKKAFKSSYAIFDIDGNQISKWFDWIDTNGLIDGRSNYYIAKRKTKFAIFHKDGYQVSDWFSRIEPYGLILGEGNLYIARKNRKYAIFDLNKNQISDWFNGILTSPFFFQDDKEEYYIGIIKNKWAIYHISGKKVSKDFPVKELNLLNVEEIRFDNNNGILGLFDEDGILIKKFEFDPIYPFKENLPDYTKLLNI